MESNGNQQISHQKDTSTTMWTQPANDEQKAYYSKHAAERRVFGWISVVLQVAHGILAFAAFSHIFEWVLHKAPAIQFLVPYAALGTIVALHTLFRTTWSTYWYDRLDNDPNTDSPIVVPILIATLLLLTEVQGARMFLDNQIEPPKRESVDPVEKTYASTSASIDASYKSQTASIESVYAQKERAVSAKFDRSIRSLRGQKADTPEAQKSIRSKIASLEAQRDNALSPILAAKANELEKAMATATARKDFEASRRDKAVGIIDDTNASEVARHLDEKGAVNQYAWMLSFLLLSIISLLLYRLVRINVKSGIIPLRSYTILDAHGSVAERIWTAMSDAFNRQGMRLAVAIHRFFSPSKPLTSFDGTVIAQPGTYNTPQGFFTSPPPVAPPPPDDEATIRAKVFTKLSKEAQNGGIQITSEMLEDELSKAKAMNGSYLASPLGKPEPSAAPTANVEGPYPADDDEDKYLVLWASRVHKQVTAYDAAMRTGNPEVAEEAMKYINDPSGPIRKEAERLGIQFGVEAQDDEIVVWNKSNPAHKVPLSMLSQEALKAANAATDSPSSLNRFKSDLNQFQDEVQPYYENGKVIGVKYKKDDGTWSVIGSAATASRLRISERYASVDNPSPKVLAGLAKWQYAMSLIKESVPARVESLETITA